MQNARKRFWWSWALLVVVMVAKSSTFVNIDWSTLSRDSLLPRVAETVNLGAGWQDCCYRVHIDYPEYEPLTKAETNILKKLNITPTDTLSYSWSIGVSRKEGIGQLSIIPVVKQGGKWLKLVSYKLRLETSAPSLRQVKKQKVDQDRYASHSVLREGRWVKIRVSEEGIYQLTPSLLSRMGFGEIDKVKVYGYGGRVQNAVIKYTGSDADTDDLEEVPLYRRNDALLFYANGTLRWSPWTWSSVAGRYVSERSINPYSKYSYYFVTEGDSPLRIASEDTIKTPHGQTVTTYPEHLLLETDNYSWYTSGRHLYDSYNFATGSSKSYTLATPDLDTSAKSWLRVAMGAYAQEATRAEIMLNGKSEGIIVMDKAGQYDYAIQGSLAKSTEDVVTGENTLNISSTASHDARLDYISLNYDRQLRLTGAFLPFSHYLTGTQRFQLQGADTSTQIWRIGQAGEVMQSIPGELSGGVLSFKVKDATRRYVAVNTAAQFPEPEVVGQIVNQDLHADSVADMVIIIPASGKLLSQAERLADFHRTNDSLRVRVVRADQIYNEFSSGTPDAGAYRRYMKMLYDRAEVEADCPRYLLLFGGCLWDNRMLTTQTRGLNSDDYLLCYESENSVSEVSSYVTDDFFGLLYDGEGGELTMEKIDLGIGRFPVTTAADAQTLVDKTISYVNNAYVGSWKNAIYMMADDGDNNGHMKDAEAVAGIVESNYSPMMVKRIYWDAYSRVVTATGNTYPEVTAAIKNAMKKGALIMNYSGHGAPYQISHEQVLKLADFKEFSSSNVPMWVIASCILTPYDMPTENIGEVSMLNKNGAAVAFFSASRAVYSDLNRYLNKNYMNYVLGSDAEGRRYTIGDAARLTKVNLVDSRLDRELDYTINKLKYALMGDPALTLSMPTAQVVLDEINGQKIVSGCLPQLKAGSVVTIKGHVEADGTLLPDFTGSVSLLLQDSQDTIVCKNNVGAEVSPYIYKERTKTLYEGSDSVKNGVFETRFPFLLTYITPMVLADSIFMPSIWRIRLRPTVTANLLPWEVQKM